MCEYNGRLQELVGCRIGICVAFPNFSTYGEGELLWVEEFDLCIRVKKSDIIYNRDHIIYVEKK